MREPVELSVDECLDLLSGGIVGRIALATPVGPRILPVNYAFVDDRIVVRTAPYTELGTYGPRNDAAFEVDHLDYDRQRGWSVVAIGHLDPLEPYEIQDLRKVWEPRPWVGGSRNLYLALRWREISGRRIGGDWMRAPAMPVRRVVTGGPPR